MLILYRRTQRDRVLALLQGRAPEWVPLPDIIRVAAQYNSRIHELRKLGYQVENKREGDCSWFRLVTNKQTSLFPLPDRSYLE